MASEFKKLFIATTDGRCRYCGKKVDDYWHLEHIIPKSQGGENKIENYGVSCPTCNMRKGGRTPKGFKIYIKNRMIKKSTYAYSIFAEYIRYYVSIDDLEMLETAFLSFMRAVAELKITFHYERGSNG